MRTFALGLLGWLRAAGGAVLVVGGAAATEPGTESPPSAPSASAPVSSEAAPAAAAQPAKDRTAAPRARAETPVSYLGGELVKMARAGVGSEVLRAYVERSTYAAQPRAEEIVYLHECGVPPEVVTALINRAGQLRTQAEQAAAPSPAVVSRPAPPAAVQVVVPQPVYVYPPQAPPVTYTYTYAYPRYVYTGYPAWGYVWPRYGWSAGFGYRSGWGYGHRSPVRFYGRIGGAPGRGPWTVPGGRLGGAHPPRRR